MIGDETELDPLNENKVKKFEKTELEIESEKGNNKRAG